MPQLTIEQAFDLAYQHHQAGRLGEAENLYRQILSHNPNHVNSLHLLGVVAYQGKRYDIATDLIRRALALRPDYPQAHSNLGNVLRDTGHLDQAITEFRRAISLSPNFPEAHGNLGNALRDKGRIDDAIAAFRQAITLNPNLPETHSNLGHALRDKGQLDEAVAAYQKAIALRPNYALAHSNLGAVLVDKGELDLAIAAFRAAVACKPDFAEGFTNLGNALKDNGQLDEALAAYRQAIALRPGYAEAHSNRGNVLRDKGQLDESLAACQTAISLNPNLPEAHTNRGNALRDKGQLDEAIFAYRQAISLNPKLSTIHSNLGSVLQDNGQLDDALAAYQQAMSLSPSYASTHSGMIYALHLSPASSAQSIAAELRLWNERHAQPLKKFIQPHANFRDPGRRLRIGYVSPDFCHHVVGHNLLPLFRHHDREQFEITCYAHINRNDAMTAQFQQHADRWRDITKLTDQQSADQIRQDEIDILVDLALHTAHNRLLVFAQKPAPVQATFAGYPGSTGLSTIDYRLSDPYLDPLGSDESIFSEKTLRLAHSFWCYDPTDGRDIPITPLPALGPNVFTFGCLNNPCKVNDDVLALWSNVLRQVPNSRLLLLAPPSSYRTRTLERFSQERIDPARIEFVGRLSHQDYIKVFHRIDLGLDTFPYNGHTTSLDSLWMGVPVITLVGNTPVARAGWCQLSNLGLGELAAKTAEQFVQIAAALAKDLPRLEQLRSTLRQRMEQSPLMDAPYFARNIEAAYRQMWRNWCENASTNG
jgi:predicted O-linked N-acetylglucosamine transferase (SPINDLY family)